MKKIKIIVATILALLLLIAAIGFYTFIQTFMDDDFYYSGEGERIYPESYKVFYGSWFLENPSSGQEEGFILKADGKAFSINMATLVYKKWKIVHVSTNQELWENKLVLTAISLGNHVASVSDEEYIIKSFNSKRMVLERNGNIYTYEKLNRATDSLLYLSNSLSVAFEYFPVDDIDTAKNSTSKHPVDFESNSESKQFMTTILQQYNSSASSANFAGYYVVVTWGCGSGCLDGVLVDTRDGKLYNLPSKEGYSDIGSEVEHKRNSIMLITSFLSTTYIPKTTNREVERHYWLWNESSKEFLHYKSDMKIVSN